jgi:hypothetical protein
MNADYCLRMLCGLGGMDQGGRHLPDLGIPIAGTLLQNVSGTRIMDERKSNGGRHTNGREVFLSSGQETLN